MAFLSRVYRGFCMQQTANGWIILNAPNYNPKTGPVPKPPYQTYWACEKIIDRFLE